METEGNSVSARKWASCCFSQALSGVLGLVPSGVELGLGFVAAAVSSSVPEGCRFPPLVEGGWYLEPGEKFLSVVWLHPWPLAVLCVHGPEGLSLPPSPHPTQETAVACCLVKTCGGGGAFSVLLVQPQSQAQGPGGLSRHPCPFLPQQQLTSSLYWYSILSPRWLLPFLQGWQAVLEPSPRSRVSLPVALCQEDSLPSHGGRTVVLLLHPQKRRVLSLPQGLKALCLGFRVQGRHRSSRWAPRGSQAPPLLPCRLSPVSCGSELGKGSTFPLCLGLSADRCLAHTQPAGSVHLLPSSACWHGGHLFLMFCHLRDGSCVLSLLGGAGSLLKFRSCGDLARGSRWVHEWVRSCRLWRFLLVLWWVPCSFMAFHVLSGSRAADS